MGVCANDCFFDIGVHSVKCAIYTGWRLIALEPYPQRNYLFNYHNNHTSRYTDSMGVGGNDCSFDTGVSSVVWALYNTTDD